MADATNIAKVEYVLENADAVVDGGETKAYFNYINGKNRRAKTVVCQAEIGGKTYFAVEAVPNTSRKAVFVVSTYINKTAENSPLTDAKSPDVDVQNDGSISSADFTVPQNEGGVNTQNVEYDLTTAEGLRAQAAALERRAAALEQREAEQAKRERGIDRRERTLDRQEERRKQDNRERREKEQERRKAQERKKALDKTLDRLAGVERVLRRPTKESHIPAGLVGLATDLVMEIEDSIDGGGRIEARIAELEKAKRGEKDLGRIKRLDTRIRNLKEAGDNLHKKLSDIHRAYGEYIKAENAADVYGDAPIGFLERVEAMLIDSEGNPRHIDDLDTYEIEQLAQALQCISRTATDVKRLMSETFEGQDKQDVGLQMEREAKNNTLLSGGGKIKNFAKNLFGGQLAPIRYFDAMGGFAKESVWKQPNSGNSSR